MKKTLGETTKGTFLYPWVEFAMGRVCNGPRLLWAEFVMGRDVPEPDTLVDETVLKMNFVAFFQR